MKKEVKVFFKDKVLRGRPESLSSIDQLESLVQEYLDLFWLFTGKDKLLNIFNITDSRALVVGDVPKKFRWLFTKQIRPSIEGGQQFFVDDDLLVMAALRLITIWAENENVTIYTCGIGIGFRCEFAEFKEELDLYPVFFDITYE